MLYKLLIAVGIAVAAAASASPSADHQVLAAAELKKEDQINVLRGEVAQLKKTIKELKAQSIVSASTAEPPKPAVAEPSLRGSKDVILMSVY